MVPPGSTVMTQSARVLPRLWHEEVGRTDAPSLLLLHGWGCDSSYLAPQAAYFARSRRVVSVDLPGHGRSRDIAGTASVSDMAAAVRDVCGAIGLSGAVVVGHSMGGSVALELALQQPALVSALVLVDTLLFPAPEMYDLLVGMAARLRGPESWAALGQASAALSIPVDAPAVAARYMASLERMSPDAAAATFAAHLVDFRPETALATFGKPLAYIGAETPMADVARLKELSPRLKVGQTLGSGHFAPLLVPDQVNAMLAGFLSAYVDGP